MCSSPSLCGPWPTPLEKRCINFKNLKKRPLLQQLILTETSYGKSHEKPGQQIRGDDNFQEQSWKEQLGGGWGTHLFVGTAAAGKEHASIGLQKHQLQERRWETQNKCHRGMSMCRQIEAKYLGLLVNLFRLRVGPLPFTSVTEIILSSQANSNCIKWKDSLSHIIRWVSTC